MINELRSLESSKQQRKMKVVLFLALAGICIANGKPMNWRNISRNFLQRKTLDVDFCKGLGYNYSSVMNFFMDEDSRSTAKNVIFRALSFLDRTSCSKLIKPLTCSIFAPSFVELFGAVPPCKSMCQEAERSCRPLLDFAAQFSPLSQPGKTTFNRAAFEAEYYWHFRKGKQRFYAGFYFHGSLLKAHAKWISHIYIIVLRVMLSARVRLRVRAEMYLNMFLS